MFPRNPAASRTLLTEAHPFMRWLKVAISPIPVDFFSLGKGQRQTWRHPEDAQLRRYSASASSERIPAVAVNSLRRAEPHDQVHLTQLLRFFPLAFW